MSHIFIGIDLGGTAAKVAAYDGADGSCLAIADRETPTLTPHADWVEYEPESYRTALFECLREVVAKLSGPIGGISISSQGQAFIVLDDAGRPLRNIIVWHDNRATAETHELNAAFARDDVMARRPRRQFVSLCSGAKWLWISRHEPDVWCRVRQIMMLPEYVGWLLTGERRVDHDAAGSTQCFDACRGEWWTEAVERCGASVEQLGEIVGAGARIGTVTPEAAEQIGLTDRPPVFAGANDQLAGALGVGNVARGTISGTVGTATALIANLGGAQPGSAQQLHWAKYVIDGQFYALTFGKTGAALLTWFRDQLTPGKSYDDIAAEADAVPIGCDGLTCIPHFQGVATPSYRSDVRGAFIGASLSHRREHFARAVMEAVCFSAFDSLELLRTIDFEPERIILTGGAARSAIWMQMMADVLGMAIDIPRTTESATLGAAMIASVGAGCHPDLPAAAAACAKMEARYAPCLERREGYLAAWRRYRELMERLYPGAL